MQASFASGSVDLEKKPISKDFIISLDIGTTVISAAGTTTSVLTADTGEAIVIPGDAWFLRAEFERSGPDLKLTGPDGQKLLIRDYFSQENPPDLTTSDGVVLKGDIAVRLAGPLAPGQYAQATATTDSEPIGQVVTSTGKAEVVHADGTRETLQQGSPIFQGDILETGEDGSIGVVFADESTFSLGESGRMTLDEMVYDPGQQTGSMNVSLLQGAFTFVSGEIAKTDPNAMTMTTPTATIGIRGTAAGGRVDEAGVTTTALLPEAAGFTGEMTIGNDAGSQTINQPGQAINIASTTAAPSAPFVMSAQQMGQSFGGALAALPNAGNAIGQTIIDGAAEGVEQQAAAEENAAAVEAAAEEAAAEAAAAGEAEAAAVGEAEAAAAEAEVAAAEADAANVEAEAAAESHHPLLVHLPVL